MTSDPNRDDATRDLAAVAAKDAEARRAEEQAGQAAERGEEARAAEEAAERDQREAREREERARREAEEARRRAESASQASVETTPAADRPGAVAIGRSGEAAAEGGQPIVFGPFTAERPELLVGAAFVAAFLFGRILKKITE